MLVRHRRLRRQRPAGDGDRRRRGARAVPLGGVPRGCLVRLHQHRALRLLPRVRRLAPAVDRRAAGRRGRTPCGLDPLEMRRRNLLRPGEEVRPAASRSTPTSSATSRRSPSAVGWGEPKGAEHRPRRLSVGLLAAGAHPVSSAVVRMEADGEVVVLVGSTELGQGPRTAFAQIAAEELGWRPSASACAAPTPASRRTTARRVPAARRRSRASPCSVPHSRCARTSSRSPAHLADGPTSSSRWRAGRRRARTFPSSSQHFGLAGGELIGDGERPPGGHRLVRRGAGLLGGLHRRRRGRRRPRDRGGARRADGHGRGRRQGDQPPARRAPGRGRHDAGHRQRAVRGDGLQDGRC